jgi:hypothetical protein
MTEPKESPAAQAVGLEVTHDGEATGVPRERCCVCRNPTNYWYAPKDVALCVNCAKVEQPMSGMSTMQQDKPTPWVCPWDICTHEQAQECRANKLTLKSKRGCGTYFTPAATPDEARAIVWRAVQREQLEEDIARKEALLERAADALTGMNLQVGSIVSAEGSSLVLRMPSAAFAAAATARDAIRTELAGPQEGVKAQGGET